MAENPRESACSLQGALRGTVLTWRMPEGMSQTVQRKKTASKKDWNISQKNHRAKRQAGCGLGHGGIFGLGLAQASKKKKNGSEMQ